MKIFTSSLHSIIYSSPTVCTSACSEENLIESCVRISFLCPIQNSIQDVLSGRKINYPKCNSFFLSRSSFYFFINIVFYSVSFQLSDLNLHHFFFNSLPASSYLSFNWCFSLGILYGFLSFFLFFLCKIHLHFILFFLILFIIFT